MKKSLQIGLLAAAICLASAGTSSAALTSYPTPGLTNAATYTFTATATGPVTAYFVGQSAGYGSVIGLSINGATPAFSSFGLQNHLSAPGDSFVLGNVTIGDTLRFILAVDTAGGTGPATAGAVDYYLNSDVSLNPVAGEQHVYSAPYAGGDPFGPSIQNPSGGTFPAGTYIGFEDISPLSGGDKDYDDHQFLFTNVGVTSTPEGGATLAMMGMGLLGVAVLRRRLK